MSSGQSLRNGNSVEPGLPNTFLMPNARNRSKVASLTVTDLLSVLVGLRGKGKTSVLAFRHCEERSDRSNPFFLRADIWIASLRSQCRAHHSAVPFIVGWPCEFAVHNSMPLALSSALIVN